VSFFSGVNPNPVYNSTTIGFYLSKPQNISIKIFDLNGRLVSTLVDQVLDEGNNEIVWSAEEENAGIYFLQFQSAQILNTQTLVVTK